MTLLNFLEDSITLFAIVNPIGNLPIFIQLTAGLKQRKRNKIVTAAVIIAFLILAAFSISGEFLMGKVFRITLDEIKIIGGLVLLVLAIRNMGFAPETGMREKKEEGDIAAFPLAFPVLVASVSLITGLMVVKDRGYIGALSVFMAVFLASWLILRFGTGIVSLLGKKSELVLNIFSKIMYVLLAAKAVKVIMSVASTYNKS